MIRVRSCSVVLCIAALLTACSVPAVTFTPDDAGVGDPPLADATVPLEDASPGPAPACDDQVKNGSETDEDCGGSCGPCEVGRACAAGSDCTTGVCDDNQCQAAACDDDVHNGDESDRDCGGSCTPCPNGLACDDTTDCASQVCADLLCQAATCIDDIKNGQETDFDCGGPDCAPCPVGDICRVDVDCASDLICDASVCRVARSCAEIKARSPDARDGVYAIAPIGGSAFDVVCDMTRDGGGWTLLLKADGVTADPTDELAYDSPLWTNTTLLAETDLTTQSGNAKYRSFVELPITTLRGELDGFRYTKSFAARPAQQIFDGGPDMVSPYPTFNDGGPPWSTQPNCQTFGVNTSYEYARTRFGWTANQENDCVTNDTAIGLGLSYNITAITRSAGYICQSTECNFAAVNQGGIGLLWGR